MCPKFDGDAKQTLEILVERKRNLKLGELGELSFGMLKLGNSIFYRQPIYQKSQKLKNIEKY